MFLSCPIAMMPCSFVSSIVLTPTSNWIVCAHTFPLKSQNFILPSFAQLTINSRLSCISFVIWEVCSVGKFRIKFPVFMSHIFIVLSIPPLNKVESSWRSTIDQIKSKWPVSVFRHAELYFFVKLHTLMVLSALPEMRVCPLVVHYRQRISLMCPEKFFTFSPFSKSHIFIL